MSNSKDLQLLRNRINEIDEKINALLIDRFTLSKAVKESKLEDNIPFYQPDRVASHIDDLLEDTPNSLKQIMKRFWSEVMSLSLSLQTEMKIYFFSADQLNTEDLRSIFSHYSCVFEMTPIEAIPPEIQGNDLIIVTNSTKKHIPASFRLIEEIDSEFYVYAKDNSNGDT